MKKILVLLFGAMLSLDGFCEMADSLEAPPIIPYWALGHWVWEDERNTRDAVFELVNGYREHGILVNAVIIDSPWMTQYNDFIWDETHYPNWQQMIDSLHAMDIKVLAFYTGCLNSSSNSGSKEKCRTYDYAVANNFCVNGNKESKWFKGPGVHIDFTKQEAKEWWHTQTNQLHQMKIDGAKIDFGFAWFGDSIQTSAGKLSRREFGFCYYADAFDFHSSQNPEFVAMTYAWSGLGLMGFPSKSHVNWVGDFSGDWKGIESQLKNIYLSANYGFSGIACEIGGYWKVASNKEEFIRYAQLSSLCPIMINGGSLGAFEHHLPWKYDQETVEIYKSAVLLHNELAPYLFSTSVDAHLNHSTIIRHANFEEKSHFLGDQLFIKVITDSLSTTSVKLPDEGNWVDWYTGQVYEAGSVTEKQYGLNQYPLFIRQGAILPLQEENRITFQIYPYQKSEYIFHMPQGNGIGYSDITIGYDAATHKLTVKSEKEMKFRFRIKQTSAPNSVENADKVYYDAANQWLYIKKEGANFEITIH